MQPFINREKEPQSMEKVRSMTWLPKKRQQSEQGMYLKRLHVLPNSLFDDISLIRLNRKRMYESCTFKESYPSLQKTEINNTTSFGQSPGKILFAHDCESTQL